jgi:hypothetical protein
MPENVLAPPVVYPISPSPYFYRDKMKLQKTVKGQYFLTVPAKIVEAKGWDKGKKLTIRFNERGNLELEEQK